MVKVEKLVDLQFNNLMKLKQQEKFRNPLLLVLQGVGPVLLKILSLNNQQTQRR